MFVYVGSNGRRTHNRAQYVHLSYTCHDYYVLIVNDMCACLLSLCSCVYSACAGSLQALCGSASAQSWLLGAPQGFCLDMLDWLSAPSMTGKGHNVLRIPSNGHEQFSVSLCLTHKQCDITVQNQNFRRVQLEEKIPKSGLKSGSKT